MPRRKIIVEELAEELKAPEAEVQGGHTPAEKERLLGLYQTLLDLNIHSISDLENLIARTE